MNVLVQSSLNYSRVLGKDNFGLYIVVVLDTCLQKPGNTRNMNCNGMATVDV